MSGLKSKLLSKRNKPETAVVDEAEEFVAPVAKLKKRKGEGPETKEAPQVTTIESSAHGNTVVFSKFKQRHANKIRKAAFIEEQSTLISEDRVG